MTRFQSEPFYSLLDRQGREDIKWAAHTFGLGPWLLGEIISDTWYHFMFKLGRR